MGLDTQAFDGALKDVAEPFIAEQVNNANPLQDLMDFEETDFGGREKYYSAHVGRNSSPMFTREDGASATAGNQVHVPVRIDQRKMTGRIRITYEAMVDSVGRENAFVSARRDEMERLIDDMARRQEFALATDGRGVLARVDDANPDGDTTLELDAPGGITGNDFGNRFIEIGMFLAFINPATGALRNQVATQSSVTAVNSDGTDVTLSSATVGTDVADSDFVVQSANGTVTTVTDTSFEAAWWGLEAHIDDGTNRANYFGIDRNTYDAYNSFVTASTGALSLDLLQRVADVTDQKLGGKISLIACHHSVRRLYIQLLEADRRYSGADLKRPDGGTVAFKQGDLTVGEVPIRAIRDIALGTMYLLDAENTGFVQYVSEAGKWVDEDGSILQRVGTESSFKDAFEAVYRIRKQFHARHPGKSAKLAGITGQTLVVVRAP